jgi:hypothetical protein
MTMEICRVCESRNVVPMFDAGSQPISNRFVRAQGEEEATFPFKLNLCRDCAMPQLADVFPVEELKPKFDWITYNEPEDHLDKMVEMLVDLPGLSSDSLILGISFKDDTTLRRLEKKGFKHTIRIDPAAHLGIIDRKAGVETLQYAITPHNMRQLASCIGKASLIVVRHVLEHVYNLREFLEGMKELMAPGAYLVVEVPDCSRAIARLDYTTLWEEHVLYFSAATLRRCLEESDFKISDFITYPYAFEDSLVSVAQVKSHSEPTKKENVSTALSDAMHFAQEFKVQRDHIRSFIKDCQSTRGKVAMFGAGHLACAYINLFGLKEMIDFVVDDNPNKKNLFMPGSQLPILGSQALLEKNIKVCLLALNPMGEAKVVERNASFTDQGGIFFSIFGASHWAFKAGG